MLKRGHSAEEAAPAAFLRASMRCSATCLCLVTFCMSWRTACFVLLTFSMSCTISSFIILAFSMRYISISCITYTFNMRSLSVGCISESFGMRINALSRIIIKGIEYFSFTIYHFTWLLV